MKKFTSLFFALAVMLSVNAALPREVARKMAKENKVELASPFTSHVVRTKAGKGDRALSIAGQNVVIRKVHHAALDAIDIEFEESFTYKYSDYLGDWEIKAENADFSVALDIINNNGASLAGNYTEDDLYGSNGPSATYNNVTIKATNERKGISTAAITVNDDGIYTDLYAELVCADGSEYNVSMFYATPIAESSETISANMFMFEEEEDYFGYVFYTTTISGANDDYQFSFTFDDAISSLNDGDTLFVGTDIEGSIAAVGGSASSAYSGYLAVTAVDGNYRLRGEVLCYNNVEYTLDLIYVLPAATRSDTFTADVVLNDIISSNGVYQLYGYNSDKSKYVTLAIYANQVAGTYALSDLYKSYSYVMEYGVDTVQLTPISANLTVAVAANGDVTLTGTMRMMNRDDYTDVVDYTLNLTYTKPVATRTANVNATATFMDFADESGDWYIEGTTADGNTFFAIDFYYLAAGVVAGTYEKDDIFAYYTFVGVVNGNDTVYYDFVDANFTVAVDANNNATLTGTMTAQNYDDLSDVVDYTFNVTFAVAASSTGLDYDDDSDFNHNFATYTIDDSYLAQYGVLYADAEDAAGYIASLLFFLPTGATDLANGVYTIADTQAPGTVYPGSVSSNNIYSSYVATLDAEGSLSKVWYLISGNVTVANGVITVDALNSLGHSIHAVFAAVSAVDNVESGVAVQKVIRDGQVIIRHADKEYNALGVEMK